MSTQHHTAHVAPFALDASEFNAPLGQLDAAIVSVEGDVNALLASVGSGAGWASTLDGAAAAGQKVIPVASTVGAIVGMPFYIGLTSGTHEVGIIASIDAGVSVTAVANLVGAYGPGDPISATPAEVADARGGFATLGDRLDGSLVFNARNYGAVGDGTTDDTAAIELASLAAATSGGVLYLPAGTYLVSWFENPDFATYWAGVIIRAGCTLRGDGIGATTIKLADSQASHAAASIVQNHTLTGNDEGITIADLTVDGNGDNQTTLYQGVSWVRARGLRHSRIRVRNVRGTAASPPGETYHFGVTGCSDVMYTDCEAIGTAGTQGSGFASNYCTNVTRTGCVASAMSEGMGFADYYSRGVLNVNCVAQQCGTNGFNAEFCEGYICLGCRGGGQSAEGATNYPWAADTPLGNDSGFTINSTTRAALIGCLAEYNTNNGVSIVATGADLPQCQLIGGVFANNTNSGIYFGSVAAARVSSISPSTVIESNGNDLNLNGGEGEITAQSTVPAPVVPASGVSLTNDYPFDVTVYMVGGTLNFVQVDGATIATAGGMGTYRVKPGGTILWNGTVAPTWVWSRR